MFFFCFEVRHRAARCRVGGLCTLVCEGILFAGFHTDFLELHIILTYFIEICTEATKSTMPHLKTKEEHKNSVLQ